MRRKKKAEARLTQSESSGRWICCIWWGGIVEIAFCRLRLKSSAAFLVVTLATCGCATVGPQSITAGRGIYNEVINRTEDEQILNALVRLRYDETFGMLSVASVTANLRFKTQAGVQAGFGDSVDFAGNLVPFSAGVAYEENPTISYVPLNGEDFMRRMISPLSVSEWVLLSNPIRRKDLLFALAVQRVNALRNSLPGEGPPSPAFIRLVELYGNLRSAAVLDLVQVKKPWRPVKYFWSIHDYTGGQEDSVREFLDLLGIDAKLEGSKIVLPIREAVGRSESAVHLQTRSPYDVFRVFGTGIELPSAHLESGVVHPISPETTEKWQFIKIRSSTQRSGNATVQIEFRGSWFHIDATDTQSKRAFAFLRTLIGIRLAAPAASRIAPVLTVPVN